MFAQDDDAGMDFVAAAANIRSHVFGIPLKSRFDIKCKIDFISTNVLFIKHPTVISSVDSFLERRVNLIQEALLNKVTGLLIAVNVYVDFNDCTDCNLLF